MLFIIIIAFVIVSLVIMGYLKRLRYGNLTLITGGVKTGKTQLSVCLVYKTYKKQLRKWRKACRKAKRQYKPYPEKPMIYSNMPLGKYGMEYCPLTLDLIMGKRRFAFGSVVYYNEASLIAGSKDIKDEELNDHLLKFFKLCAHFTKGGYVILDTQSPQDVHYTIKRSLSTYYDIQRRLTLPFISLIWLRENKLVDGENTVALDTQIDPQDNVLEGGKKWYFRPILNKWWRYYDQYAYSSLVEDLKPYTDTKKVTEDLRITDMIRCRDIRNALKGENKNEKNK